jgi:hypothetical protein
MADITKADLRDMILQHLVVLAVGQTANAADAALVELAIDSAHDRLNKRGLTPFPVSLIPSWAQIPLRDYVAIDVSPSFGREVQRLPDGTSPIQNQALVELHAQCAGYKHAKRTKAVYY